MSNVTGQIGNDQVYLENAATEATLQLLLKATLATTKAQKAAIAELAEKSGLDADSVDRANKGTSLLGATARGAGAAFGIITGITTKLGSAFQGVIGFAESIANNEGRASNVFAALAPLPFGIGAVMQGFSALQKIQEDQLDAYQRMTTAGVGLAGNLDQIRMTAGRLNLTLPQFAELMARNGAELSRFGGTVVDGAKAFIRISADLNNGQTGRALRGLGYTSEQINEHLMKYIAISGGRTRDELRNTRQITDQTVGYLKELDRLAEITGKSREEQEKALEAQTMEANWQIYLERLGADIPGSKERLTGALTTFTGLMGQAGADILKAGAQGMQVQTEEGQRIAQISSRAYQDMLLYAQAARDGTMSEAQLRQLELKIRQEWAEDAGALAGAAGSALNLFGPIQEAGLQAARDRNKTTAELNAEDARVRQEQAARGNSQAADQADRQVEMLKMANDMMSALLSLSRQLTPTMDLVLNKMKDFTEWLATTLNENPDLMKNFVLGLKDIYDTFMKIKTEILTPTFTWIGDKMKQFGISLGDLVLGVGLVYLAFKTLPGIIGGIGLLSRMRGGGGRGREAFGPPDLRGAPAGGAGGAGFLSGVGAEFTKAAGWLFKGLAIGASLVAIGYGIKIMGEGFQSFKDVDWSQTLIGLGVITGIATLAAFGGQVAGIGLAALGAGLLVFSGGLWLFGKGLESIVGAGVTKEYLIDLGLGILGLVSNMPYAQMVLAAPGMVLFGPAAMSLAAGLRALSQSAVNSEMLTNIGTGLKGMLDDNMPYLQMGYAAPGMVLFGNAAPTLASGLMSLKDVDVSNLGNIAAGIANFASNLPDDGWFEDSAGEKLQDLASGFGPLGQNLDVISKTNPNNLILITNFVRLVVASKLGRDGIIIFTDHTVNLMRQFTTLPLKTNIDQIVRLKDVAIDEMPAATANIDRFNNSLGNLLKADVAKINQLAQSISELKAAMTLDPGQDTSVIETIVQRLVPSGESTNTGTPGTKEAAEGGPFEANADYSGNTNQLLERGLEDLNNNMSRLLNISSQISDNTYRTANRIEGGNVFRQR